MCDHCFDSVSRRACSRGAAAPLLRSAGRERPNILWLTWEDIGPHLHCCGDEYSTIPNFDYLAKGLRL
jgi:uncharacterized sulfatase